MPNRLLREGIIGSESVNSLPPEAEVFYRRLMSVVDDFGRYSAHSALLRAALYPLQLDRVSEAHIIRHLATCRKANLLLVYVHEGKRFLELLKFGQHVRAKNSKWPAPPDQCATDAVHQNRICQTDAPGDGDGDGDEYPLTPSGGSEEGHSPNPSGQEKEKRAVETFASFWTAYPRRVGKVPAEKAWRKHDCADLLPQILAALERQRNHPQWTKDGGQFIPHPATWINQQRWQDEAAVSGHNGHTRPHRSI